MDSGTWNPPQLRENFEQQDICCEQIALIDQFADQPKSPTPNFSTAIRLAHADSETDFAPVSRKLTHLNFAWFP